MQTHATPKNRQEEDRLILTGDKNDQWAHTRYVIWALSFLLPLRLEVINIWRKWRLNKWRFLHFSWVFHTSHSHLPYWSLVYLWYGKASNTFSHVLMRYMVTRHKIKLKLMKNLYRGVQQCSTSCQNENNLITAISECITAIRYLLVRNVCMVSVIV